VTPVRTVQLSSGQFIACTPGDPSLCVCLIGTDGSVVKSFVEAEGSGGQRMYMPDDMAVDRNGFVFVVDYNRRVLLLSPQLMYVRDVLPFSCSPQRVHLDSDRGRLYVAGGGCVMAVGV